MAPTVELDDGIAVFLEEIVQKFRVILRGEAVSMGEEQISSIEGCHFIVPHDLVEDLFYRSDDDQVVDK